MLIPASIGFSIFQYESPIVTVEHGSGYVISGHFKLIHAIDLKYFDTVLAELTTLSKKRIGKEAAKSLIDFQLNQTRLRLIELTGEKTRKARSINWIGSAWKWIAGSPDAADWDYIVKNQNELMTNDNNQYVINKKLFNATQEVIQMTNDMVEYTNVLGKHMNAEGWGAIIFNKVLLLKEQVSEIVRAAQMAKSGIVDTNLLDREEMERILFEENALPYQNLVEAAEYASPSFYSNGTLLLYVLSVPKVKPEQYRLLLARPTTLGGRRVVLEYRKVLINRDETYGVMTNCFSINNSTICDRGSIERLPENSCLPRLIKGGNARCQFEPDKGTTIELIEENTIFLTNFQGIVWGKNQTATLNGTFLIRINNETVHVGNQTFLSTIARTSQVLPSVLSNVTNDGLKVSLSYIHGLSLDNINQLKKLSWNFHLSWATDGIVLIILASACYMIWRKITSGVDVPRIVSVAEIHQLPASPATTETPPATTLSSAGRRFLKGEELRQLPDCNTLAMRIR